MDPDCLCLGPGYATPLSQNTEPPTGSSELQVPPDLVFVACAVFVQIQEKPERSRVFKKPIAASTFRGVTPG